MTQDELNADELTGAQLLGVLFSSGDTGEVEKVQVHLEIRKTQWDQALANEDDAKVLIQWGESKRVG